MQIDITGHQMEITEALRRRVSDSAQKLGEHTGLAAGNVHVVLEVNKQRHCCSVSAHVGGDSFSAKDDSDSMYTAIDGAIEKIRRQLEKAKNRSKESRRR